MLGCPSNPATPSPAWDDALPAVVLELLQSQRCKAWDCEDYLYMPGRRWLSDERFTARSERDAYAFLKLAALE